MRKAGRMDKEGKEGQKADNLHDQCVSHDVCRRGEKSSENVEVLEERYKSKTRVTLCQLQRQFNTIKMMDDSSNMEKHL